MVHAAQRFMHFGIQVKRNLFRRLLLKIFSIIHCRKGEPQGMEGLKFAAQNFHKVVPNIHCEIDDLLVVGDKVTARLSFTGTHNDKKIDFLQLIFYM